MISLILFPKNSQLQLYWKMQIHSSKNLPFMPKHFKREPCTSRRKTDVYYNHWEPTLTKALLLELIKPLICPISISDLPKWQDSLLDGLRCLFAGIIQAIKPSKQLPNLSSSKTLQWTEQAHTCDKMQAIAKIALPTQYEGSNWERGEQTSILFPSFMQVSCKGKMADSTARKKLLCKRPAEIGGKL